MTTVHPVPSFRRDICKVYPARGMTVVAPRRPGPAGSWVVFVYSPTGGVVKVHEQPGR